MWVLREGWRSENSQTSRLRARVHTTVFVGWENTVISAHRTKLQDTEGEKRETGRFTRETRGERARAKQRSKKSLCVKVQLTQTLYNFRTSSAAYLLIISSSPQGGGSRENEWYRKREWEMTPWMRVCFPQKNRPFVRLSRSNPSYELLSPPPPPSSAQCATPSAWRRRGFAGTRVCARACTKCLPCQQVVVCQKVIASVYMCALVLMYLLILI